jgi:Mg2+ and Co2+ transporter CorA
VPIQVFFYDAEGHDREIALDEVNLDAIGDRTLLWVDLEQPTPDETARVAAILRVQSPRALTAQEDDEAPRVQSFGEHVSVGLTLPVQRDAPGVEEAAPGRQDADERLSLVISERWLVTSHAGKAPLLQRFRDKDRAETMIGALSPASLAAALIDWHLGLFFDAASAIAVEVDSLDERVLRDTTNKLLLGRIVTLRRKTSRLRATLVANRPTFYGLSRPDCSIVSQSDAAGHYALLAARFERALDEIERLRDLINGSFDLFASRSGLQTNALVKTLTVITAVLGYFAAVAGLFGMNLKSSLFNGGDITFAVIVGVLTATSILAILFARMRKWI